MGNPIELIFPPTDLMPHQREAIRDPHRFKVLVWHRRARKTTTAIIELVKQALQRVGPYWHLFPTHVEAKDAVWRDPNMLFRIIPEEIIAKKNEQDLVVFLKNRSYIQLKGADDPDALRGAGPMGLIFDEFQKQKIEAWQTLEPVIRGNNGFAWFIGTPMGKNHFFDFYIRGQHEKFPEWRSWLLKASQSGVLKPEVLEEARRTAINEAFYNQEYEVFWLEGVGQVFKEVGEIATSVPEPPIVGKSYVIGVDLAKHQDYTVLAVFDRETNKQVFQDRFNKIDWVFQKNKIVEISRHYNHAVCVVDATGIGDPIVDDLSRMGLAVEPIKITEMNKRDMIEKLSIWIQLKRFSIINIEDSIFELENFSYKIGPTGKIHYGAPDNMHDDIVIAFALALTQLNPVIIPQQVTMPTPLQLHRQRLILREGYDYSNDLEWAEGGFDGPI